MLKRETQTQAKRNKHLELSSIAIVPADSLSPLASPVSLMRRRVPEVGQARSRTGGGAGVQAGRANGTFRGWAATLQLHFLRAPGRFKYRRRQSSRQRPVFAIVVGTFQNDPASRQWVARRCPNGRSWLSAPRLALRRSKGSPRHSGPIIACRAAPERRTVRTTRLGARPLATGRPGGRGAMTGRATSFLGDTRKPDPSAARSPCRRPAR